MQTQLRRNKIYPLNATKKALPVIISMMFSCGFSYANTTPSPVLMNQTIKPTKGNTVVVDNHPNSGTSRIMPGYVSQYGNWIGKGRFGESRPGYKDPAGGHQGIDISMPSSTVIAPTPSTVLTARTVSGGGNTMVMQRNGTQDLYYYMHLQNGSMKRPGTSLNTGESIAISGNTSGKSEPSSFHLHVGYMVLQNKQAYRSWLNSNASAGGNNVILGDSVKCCSFYKAGNQYQLTDPGLFLKEEILFNIDNDKLKPYLGNTSRTQVNALYNANLPTASSIGGIAVVQPAKPFTHVKIGTVGSGANYVDPSIEAVANMHMAQMAADNSLPANVSQKSSITPEELGKYAPPRTMFGGDDGEATIQIGDGNQTVSSNITTLGRQRLGNAEWQHQLLGLPMRGMLLEYLNMINAENYIKSKIYLQKEKIEALWAGFASARIYRYGGNKVNEAYAKTETSEAPPPVSDMPLETLIDKIQSGEIKPTESTFSHVQFKSNRQGCDAGFISLFNANKTSQRMIYVVSRRFGFDPNDLAGIAAMESRLNWQNAGAGRGLIQITKNGLDFHRNNFTVDRLVSAGASPAIAQRIIADQNLTTTTLRSMTPADYEAVMTVYFIEKGFRRGNGDKSLGAIYKSVFGGPYGQLDNATYFSANEPMNYDKTARAFGKSGRVQQVIETWEAPTSPLLKNRLCPYYPTSVSDATYGVTPDEIKVNIN